MNINNIQCHDDAIHADNRNTFSSNKQQWENAANLLTTTATTLDGQNGFRAHHVLQTTKTNGNHNARLLCEAANFTIQVHTLTLQVQ